MIKKLVLVCTIFFLSLELGLRFAGWILGLPQFTHNLRTDKNAYVIVVLGESTSASPFSTWPALLEEILNKTSKKHTYLVFNEAIPGTNTLYIAARLTNNLNRYKPDMVVTMMGINDGGLHLIYDSSKKIPLSYTIETLRTVKLIRWVVQSVQRNWYRANTTGSIVNKPFPVDKEERGKLMDQAFAEGQKNNTQLAIALMQRAIKLDPSFDGSYRHIGWLYLQEGKFADAEKAFLSAYTIATSLSTHADNQTERIKYWNSLGIDTVRDDIVSGLTAAWMGMGKSHDDISRALSRFLIPEDVFGITPTDTSFAVTAYHYKLLARILAGRGIPYVAMQYPTRSITQLEDYLSDYPETVLVSNEENFRLALKDHSYEELFTDHMTKTFGHTTKLGDMLIAEHLAGRILETVESTKSATAP